MLRAEESKRVRERDWELLNERCSFILLRWEWYGTVWKRKYLHTHKKAAVNTLDWSICPPPSLYLGNRAISQHRFISIGFYFLGFILKLHCFYFIFFCYFDSCILRVYLSFSHTHMQYPPARLPSRSLFSLSRFFHSHELPCIASHRMHIVYTLARIHTITQELNRICRCSFTHDSKKGHLISIPKM